LWRSGRVDPDTSFRKRDPLRRVIAQQLPFGTVLIPSDESKKVPPQRRENMPRISGNVEVKPQSPRRVAGTAKLSLTQASHLDPFIVTARAEPAQQPVVFELPLTEWLPELRLFLVDASELRRDRLLLFSGYRFQASRSNDGISIEVYDVRICATVHLQLDAANSVTFFQNLRSGLLSAIKGPAGETIEIDDIARVTL
jgi:hypothetical protein